MNYAVIKSGGKQYRVSEGDVIEVDKIDKKKGDRVVFEDVLLLASEDKVKVGKPNLLDQKVEGIVLDQIKGEKLYVSKFKAKVRYRKRVGFRASLTSIKIEKLIGERKISAKEVKKLSTKAKKAAK